MLTIKISTFLIPNKELPALNRAVNRKIVTLTGGVGGTKLIHGLAATVAPEDLCCIVNVGDDDVFHGLNISPDLDTVMYTLAGLSDSEKGWGLMGETFNALDSLGVLGEDTWFNIGDKDIATHLVRTRLLNEGLSLTEVTRYLCSRLGVEVDIMPVSNDMVATVLNNEHESLSMQEYFVRDRNSPNITSIEYQEKGAKLSQESRQAIERADLVIICPSNPLLSIAPMLAVRELRDVLIRNKDKTLCVSPLIGKKSITGPAGKLMTQLGMESDVLGLGRFYQNICSTIVIDNSDADTESGLVELGFSVIMLPIIMSNDEQKKALAESILLGTLHE